MRTSLHTGTDPLLQLHDFPFIWIRGLPIAEPQSTNGTAELNGHHYHI
jgi:hypothetical protein